MADPPPVDGRRREAIREHVTSIAPYYTAAWDPTTPGPGTTLVSLFAEMAEDVVERLDRVPEKHRIAFFDTLGFDRRPPEPARLPLSLTLAEGATRNVVVDGGTRAVAPATDGRPKQTFTVPDAQRFEATPARLRAAYGVDPTTDRVCDHWDPPSGAGLGGDGDEQLFVENNRQFHALYVAQAEQLNVTPPEDDGPAAIRVRVPTDADDVFVSGRIWQYYGEGSEDESAEDWHDFLARREVEGTPEDEVVFDLAFEGTLTETTVDGVESRWIRAIQPSLHEFPALADLRIGTTVEVGPAPDDSPAIEAARSGRENGDTGRGGGDGDQSTRVLAPDRMLYNDVPLPFDDESAGESGVIEDEGPYYPLGTAPQIQSTFYVAASEAFSKPGAIVELTFAGLGLGDHPMEGSDPDDDSDSDPDGDSDGIEPFNTWKNEDDKIGWVQKKREPRLSWEYWNGDGWARIDDLRDGTEALTQTTPSKGDNDEGIVRFPVPSDLAETTVAGHENRWIRCRLAGGSYGTWTAVEKNDSWESHHVVFPPEFNYLTLRYVTTTATEGESGDGNGDGDGDGGESVVEREDPMPASPATHLLAENHLSYSENLVESAAERVRPFRRLPEDEQTLYLGFDRRLHGGPITLFLDLEDTAFPNEFHTRVRWEYGTDDDWVALDVQDGTEGLTERGIVRLVFPGETEPRSLFGRELHWLRARLTGDEFDTERFRHFTQAFRAFRRSYRPVFDPVREEGAWDAFGASLFGSRRVTPDSLSSDWIDLQVQSALYEAGFFDRLRTDPRLRGAFDEVIGIEVEAGDDAGTGTDRECEPADPCGRTIETEPPSGDPTTVPPVTTVLAQNVAWTSNVREVDRETLGSSDGEPSQSFTATNPPVLAETVWVDEFAALSEGKRRALREAETPAVETETRHDGTLEAFWVAWRAVPDLLDSGEDDRHYTVDRTAGTVRFGDGSRGRVPPQGTDNVELSYRTGGGSDGNVATGAVTELASSIQFVDEVTNPAAGAGGAPAESAEAVLDRAPRELRDRDRAVASSDYERIAKDAARGITRVRCVPEMNRGGDHEPGWVTLLVVPDSGRTRPSPSTGLRSRVQSAVAERAPATLVAADRLVVRGPSYVDASVDVDVVAAGTAGVATLEEDISEAVDGFLHPLAGGEAGDGWGFGELPTMSDLYALVESVDGVDHVSRLSLTFESDEEAATVREGEESPSVSADALVYSGDHDVTVTLDGAVVAEEVE